MHEYSINKNRNRTLYFLVIFSVFISSFLVKLINHIPWQFVKIPITTSLIFGILFWLFDKFLWKWISKYEGTPDLSGTWTGVLMSSYDHYEVKYPANLVITQHWTKICIKGNFNTTLSKSSIASIKTDEANTQLFYAYSNDGDKGSGLDVHNGYTTLYYDSVAQTLKGEYFNNRSIGGRHNNGKLILKREGDLT